MRYDVLVVHALLQVKPFATENNFPRYSPLRPSTAAIVMKCLPLFDICGVPDVVLPYRFAMKNIDCVHGCRMNKPGLRRAFARCVPALQRTATGERVIPPVPRIQHTCTGSHKIHRDGRTHGTPITSTSLTLETCYSPCMT